jgi:ADP-ribose pyrophosphatase
MLYKFKKFSVKKERQTLPNGHIGEYSTVLHGGASVIIPVIGKRVVIIKEYRHSVRKWIYALPAGSINKGESPMACARRELEEETGYRASRMKKVFETYASPGISNEKDYFFIAEGLRKTTQHLEAGEMIKVLEVEIDEAVRLLEKGVFVASSAMQGILYLKTTMAARARGM